ncbi:LADA_0G05776g1_1 [Lachancea dasiensis]|uniref:LADA_0G05776g1_1 n=1 Tax=Lachancea dasiensis TaxID=1072105 RepID=A0A1G4JSX4_9SACH|nr:LADA_0G05776g1_1 [Lachancea dasiensis]
MKVIIEHVQLQFISEIENNVISLLVEQNVMCFALKSGYVFLIDLATPSKVAKYQFPLLAAPQEKILKVWMDPSATTLFLKTNFAKYYALKRTALESEGDGNVLHLKRLSKKGCDIIATTWIDSCRIICGTHEGGVYLVDLNNDNSVTRLYRSKEPVDGVIFTKTQGALLSSGDTIRHWRSVQNASKTFTESAPSETEQFEQVDKANGRKLTFHDNTFAWIGGPGIVLGHVNNSKEYQEVLSNANVLLGTELPSPSHRIKDIVLSKFHLLVLRGNELLVINKLNNKVVAQKSLWTQSSEKILEFSVDYSQNPPTIWCFSTSNIYEIILQDESEGIWDILCRLNRFDDALGVKDISSTEKNLIYLREAEYLFSGGDFIKAAQCFGNSNTIGSATVALKFIKSSAETAALQAYLQTKLQHVKMTDDNGAQVNLLTNWIVWNYVQMLNEVDEDIATEQNNKNLELLNAKKSKLNSQLAAFFERNGPILDKETVYQILSHQNRKSEALTFAKLIEDYKYVLTYWIRSKNWYESLKILLRTQDLDCLYRYATTLLINSPDATVNTWIQIQTIRPSELINPLLTYFAKFQRSNAGIERSRAPTNYALKYLMWCFQEQDKDTLDMILFNTALYMMIASFDAGDKEDEIISFIENNLGHFDHEFILRLSTKFQRNKVTIYLYSQLKLFEDAVSLAIQKGLLEEAKLVASNRDLEINSRLRRKLWLKIAACMMHEHSDVKMTIKNILQDSNDTLTIRDLLPLFDELTTIANVKDELIRDLEKHSTAMGRVSQEIQDSIKIKKEIAEDIESLKARYQTLEPGSSCAACGELLQTRKYYVFPCGHAFHTDCLMREILNSTDYSLRNKIESLQRSSAKIKSATAMRDLDSVLSTKCCFCSDIKINSIDEPLELKQAEKEAWAL